MERVTSGLIWILKRGLCTNESIRNQAPSCGESKLFLALNIGKCHLKKNYEEKSYPHLSFFGEKKNKFYLNSCDICEKV